VAAVGTGKFADCGTKVYSVPRSRGKENQDCARSWQHHDILPVNTRIEFSLFLTKSKHTEKPAQATHDTAHQHQAILRFQVNISNTQTKTEKQKTKHATTNTTTMVFHTSRPRDMSISIEQNTLMQQEQRQPSSTTLCGMLCSSPRRCLRFEGESDEFTEENCHEADEFGNLPLHRAVEQFSMDCLDSPRDQSLFEQHIASLIELYPEAVKVVNHRGLNPLHMACKEGASLAVIHSLAHAWPESIKCPTRNKQRMLPLHLVCRFYAGKSSEKVRILNYLLRAFPAAVEMATAQGDLGLHLACRNYFSTLPVIELLMEAFPDGVRTVNHKQQLPLHVACGHQYMKRVSKKANKKKHTDKENIDKENSCSSSDIIRRLVQAYPEGIQVFDCHGTLPLHAAVLGYQSPSTIQYLVDECPEAADYTDCAGRTALHLAVSRAVPNLATVQLLLAKNPAAVDALDVCNKLPLHYAQKNASLVLALAGVVADDRELC